MQPDPILQETLLPANEHARMGWYNSIYGSQYLLSKAEYESRRKKWVVRPKTVNRFELMDSSEIVTQVYYSQIIKNCECDDFIRDETGYCQHIYAIEHNQFMFRKNMVKDDPIIFVDYPSGVLVKRGRKAEPISHFDLEQIKAENPGFELTPAVAKFAAKQTRQQHIPFIADLGDFSLFKEFGVSPYDHQKESISQMLHEKRTILTLKMGLGKTICALYCTRVLENAKKVIIICPNSLKFQWKKEIERFNLGTSLVISKGDDIGKYDGQRFLILSYEMLNRHAILLLNKYDIAIIDEIQKIKNGESKTWETIRCVQSEFVFSLSGTPIQNAITDLISILKVISPREFTPDWKFYEKYCSLSRTRLGGWNMANLPELKKKLERYIINPKINWTNFKLPTKTVHDIDCSMDTIQASAHNSAFEAAKILLSKSQQYPLSFQEKARLNGLLLYCRRAVSDGRLLDPKANKSDRFIKIEELVVSKVKAGEKVVVYSDWIDCLKLLMPRLDEEGILYTIFTGELSDKVKSRNLETFTSEPEVRVFLSTDSGGLGVDGLQFVSHTMIHIEDTWNPMKLAQREGRLVRALQPANNVDVYQFNSKSGIEVMLRVNKAGKHQIISDVLS